MILFQCLADDRLDNINHRVGEKSHQHGIKSEYTDHLADIHLFIFTFQRNQNQPADNQASQLEEGEIGRSGCRVFSKAESCRNHNNRRCYDDCS